MHLKRVFSGYKGRFAAGKLIAENQPGQNVIIRGKVKCKQPAGTCMVLPPCWLMLQATISKCCMELQAGTQ